MTTQVISNGGVTTTVTQSGAKVTITIVANSTPTPTPTPSPSLSISSAVTHNEGNSGTTNYVYTLTLNRDGSTSSYPYSWGVAGYTGNPAVAADFVGASFPNGTGTFAPGETVKTITVPVNGDATVESDEGFLLTVAASGLNTVTAAGTITNDDAGGAPSPSYIGPQLTPQANATTYPPRPLLTTNAYHPVGSKLRVRAAATYANLIAGTSLLIDDASFTLTANPTTNQNGLWAVLAGITSPAKTFIDVRVEESSTVFSERSNPIMHGSTAVPAPQASIDFSVYSTFPLSGAITFAEPVYLAILGDDQISLELSGAQPGTSFTLRWTDNGSKTYTGYDDFNVDHVYDYILRRRSLADVTADSTGAVTLLDYDTTPDAFSFTPVTGGAQSALVPLDSTVFSGMAAGYGAPLTLSGAWEKFKIDSGSGFGADQTSTSGVTLQDGWDLRVYVRASSSYLTLARAIVTVGGVSANADVTTQSDPSSVSPTFQNFTSNDHGGAFPTSSAHSVVLKAGVNVLCVYANVTYTGATCPSATSVTKAKSDGTANRVALWQVVAPSDGTYTFTLTGSTGFTYTAVCAVALAGATAGATDTDALAAGFNGAPMAIGDGIVVAAGGIGLAMAFADPFGTAPLTWDVGTEAKFLSTANYKISVAYFATSVTPTYSAQGFAGDAGVTAAWSH